ncbi:hypothetical protein Q8F55_003496 [Vanrija albida]|uniref:Mid2 domain-containing protein n=1 Tax=Vanrija albida TaxID=181172 RepID=A0ABR3Q4C4_9TREE
MATTSPPVVTTTTSETPVVSSSTTTTTPIESSTTTTSSTTTEPEPSSTTTSNVPTTTSESATTTSNPPTTTSSGPTTSDGVTTTTSPSGQSSTTSAPSSASSSPTSDAGPATQFTTVTYTNSNGTVVATSALPGKGSSHSKNNTGAIVGGVVGGIGGLLLLGALAWFIMYKRKRRREVAFDEKMFDPHMNTRHSAADPLDLMGPTDGVVGKEPHVEPFTYDGGYDHHSAGHDDYDAYGQPQQQQHLSMPDHRDYMGYNGHTDNPYAAGAYAAGVGAGAAGIGAGAAYAQHDYNDDPYAASPMTTAAAAKAREAQAEASRQAYPPGSSGHGRPPSSQYSQGAETGEYHDAQQSQQQHFSEVPLSPGGSAGSNPAGDRSSRIYQHTDMLSEGDAAEDVSEIPPTYASIPRPQ